jgi:hypothetical protein
MFRDKGCYSALASKPGKCFSSLRPNVPIKRFHPLEDSEGKRAHFRTISLVRLLKGAIVAQI